MSSTTEARRVLKRAYGIVGDPDLADHAFRLAMLGSAADLMPGNDRGLQYDQLRVVSREVLGTEALEECIDGLNEMFTRVK